MSRAVAIAVVVIAAMWSVAALVLYALSAPVALPELHFPRGATISVVAICGGTGLAIALRQPRNAVGWLFLFTALCSALYELAQAYAGYALIVRGGALPAGEWAAWIGSWIWGPASATTPVFLFLVFPDGRLPSPRWRPVVAYGGFALAAFSAALALHPGVLFNAPPVPNPVSLYAPEFLASIGISQLFPLVFLEVALAVTALVRRFRRSRGVERLQLKWIAFASVLYAIGVFLDSNWSHPLFKLADFIGINAIPVAASFAIFRYRLYDIDVLIKRTLVYGITSAMLAATFVGGVIGLQTIFSQLVSGSDIAIAGSTLLSFALFRPLLTRVQAIVDRRFYRARYDAARAVDQFAARLRNEVDIEAVRADLLAVVNDTLSPAHARLWLRKAP